MKNEITCRLSIDFSLSLLFRQVSAAQLWQRYRNCNAGKGPSRRRSESNAPALVSRSDYRLRLGLCPQQRLSGILPRSSRLHVDHPRHTGPESSAHPPWSFYQKWVSFTFFFVLSSLFAWIHPVSFVEAYLGHLGIFKDFHKPTQITKHDWGSWETLRFTDRSFMNSRKNP